MREPSGRSATPGKRSLASESDEVAAPVLGRRTLAEGVAMASGEPTTPDAGDLATAAVAQKGSGAAVPASVRARVEPAVGADLGYVRVHGDAGSRSATTAMGARAFAFGRDVFLGR